MTTPDACGSDGKRHRAHVVRGEADPAAGDGVLLGSVEPGKRVRLVGIEAGRSLASRLAAMGLVPGADVLVVRNRGYGPAVVEVRGARLALGRGMTQKMRVR